MSEVNRDVESVINVLVKDKELLKLMYIPECITNDDKILIDKYFTDYDMSNIDKSIQCFIHVDSKYKNSTDNIRVDFWKIVIKINVSKDILHIDVLDRRDYMIADRIVKLLNGKTIDNRMALNTCDKRDCRSSVDNFSCFVIALEYKKIN